MVRARQIAAIGGVLVLAVIGAAIWQLPAVQMFRWSRSSLSALEQTVVADPNDWRTQYWFGKRAAEAGDFARAEPALRAAFGTTPTFLPAAAELGKVVLAQGRVDEAYQILRMVIGRDPKQWDARLALAHLYRSQEAFPLAMDILEALTAEDPKSVPALYELAVCQVGAQQPQAAEATLRSALKLDGNNGMVLTALSRVRRELGAAEEAERLARQAIERAPWDPLARLELARAVSSKQPGAAGRKEAIEILKVARDLAPNHPGILLEFSRLLVADENYEQALVSLTTLLQVDPSTTPAYHLLADALKRLGRQPESRRAQSEFLRRQQFDVKLRQLAAQLADEPDRPDLRLQIGELYAADGQLDTAIRYFRNGLARDPSNPKVRKRLSELIQLNLARDTRDAPSR